MLDRIFDLAKIQNKIAHFSEPIQRQYYQYLIQQFGSLFTFHSNRIEGVNMTLTLHDTMNIVNHTFDIQHIKDHQKQREILETMNHQSAFEYIFSILDKDVDIITICQMLHAKIGHEIIPDAGKYKMVENYLVNSSGQEISFTPPYKVKTAMEQLRYLYETKWQSCTVFERAVRLHMAIVNIHPFSDGNGRVARLLMNYELMKYHYPPVNINESQKLSYYAVIEEINTNTDYLNNPLIIGDISTFNQTIQQLSVLTFKNMQKYFNEEEST